MLLQFKAINFQSIKEEAILSMVPSSDKSHPENLAHVGKKDALKSAAIYGANAAGKSAVIRAFVAAIMVVRTSDTRNITQKIPGMVPFQFDEETAQGPACMRSTCITMPVPAPPVFSSGQGKNSCIIKLTRVLSQNTRRRTRLTNFF